MSDKKEKVVLTPYLDSDWWNFMEDTKGFDYANNKPSGWGWFWAFRHLYNDPPESLHPEIEAIQAKLPDGHWLKKINPDFNTLSQINAENKNNGLFRIANDFVKYYPLTLASTIDFSKLKFFEDAFFSDFIFLLDVYFDDTEFSDTANFNNTLFYGKAIFDGATFPRNAYFKKAKFVESAIFTNATFREKIKFDWSTFEERTDFINTKFKKYVPSFYKATIHSNTSWDWNVKFWPQTGKHKNNITGKDQKTRITNNQNAYESLSAHMKKLDKYHDEHFFYRQEMRCRRWLTRYPAKCFYWLYEKFSEYGYGIKQALWGWFLHIVLGTFLLFAHHFYNPIGKWYDALCCSFGVSFSNAHGFLSFHNKALKKCNLYLDELYWFNTIWLFQTIIGIILLFLLLLTLRIRFRLK